MYGPYSGPVFKRRREILRETIAHFESAHPRDRLHTLARANHARWTQTARPTGPRFRVLRGDWGEVTAELTREYGTIFAALNMANAYLPGGAYIEGTAAQEENMFRRTDCHFSISADQLDAREHYTRATSELLNAAHGRVFLDTQNPRVCVRGPELREREDLGYDWLEDEELFLFYELRAAAVDLRRGRRFDPDETRYRIEAQLDTLADAGVRHAVLSAFGCGAFRNPADQIAHIYREELLNREHAFDCVAFAIYDPGYGPDNYTPFAALF